MNINKPRFQGKNKHLCSLSCPWHPDEYSTKQDTCRLFNIELKRRTAFAGKGGALFSRCKECFEINHLVK